MLLSTVLLALAATPAAAESLGDGATLLVMPYVVVSQSRDTAIELTNTSNLLAHVRCYYVDAGGVYADLDLVLTRQQPTYWVVSQGRAVDPFTRPCHGAPEIPCYGAGTDPGAIPPIASDFFGELVCVQMDQSGVPLGANALAATVTVQDRSTGSIASYNAAGFGSLENDADLFLSLDGIEFESCPQSWLFEHYAKDSAVLGGEDILGSTVFVVPSVQDLDTSTNGSTLVALRVTNEFEQTVATVTTILTWTPLQLTKTAAELGSAFVRTNLQVLSGAGIIPVAEETFQGAQRTSIHAANLHHTPAVRSGLFVLPQP